MTTNALVTVSCADKVGLVAAITGYLFDVGGNLGDTSFSVLGGAAEFTAVVECPEGTDLATVEQGLKALPELETASVAVVPFKLTTIHAADARATHRLTVSGGDRPGLVARLSEVFVQFDTNIVRLVAERLSGAAGIQYVVVMDLHIPEPKVRTCLATVVNTAGGLGLTCHSEEA
ncbi:MAG: amino acid-binding protein [Rhodospirillales bacterium]|nr:amino acid-binding protein [Rhodospirillales bacterium]